MEIGGCRLPDDVLVDLEHDVWWRWTDRRRTARLGFLATLTAFAGRFLSVTFRPPVNPVLQGRSVATVESLRFTGALRAPVDVEIVARNDRVVERPRLVNDAPYEDGWVVEVRPLDPNSVDRVLESASAVRARLEETIRRRRITCWPRLPDGELVEVGAECAAVLLRLNEELARRDVGETILLVTDDPTSPIEMVRWSDQTGYPVLAHRAEDGIHRFLLEKLGQPQPRRRPG